MRTRAAEAERFTDTRRAVVAHALPDLSLGAELGNGAGGWVIAADELPSGRRLAVKVLLADQRPVPRPDQRHAEIEILTSCRHPNLIRGFYSHEVDDMLLLIMERFDGPTLLQRQERGALDIHQSCGVAIAAARALQCVHEFGFVHGDVKPQNVLYDEGGRHRLIDFGLAQRWPLARERYFAGTPEYMAPEAIEPGGTVLPATDVYALGVMIYELLAGIMPYCSADSPEGVLRMHLQAKPFPLRALAPTVPPSLSDLVMAALAQRVEDRVATAAEFADRLSKIANLDRSGPDNSSGIDATNVMDTQRGLRR